MTIHSFYIFDRHTQCIYQRRWTHATVANSSSFIDMAEGFAPSKQSARRSRPRSEADDAKLIFGVVFSLRNMVRRLGGIDDEFISYKTAQYKLHYYETPTNMKFVMLTDVKTSNMRVVLHQIWANLYVEFVVRNPLNQAEYPTGQGVGNELFEMGLERFVAQVFPPDSTA